MELLDIAIICGPAELSAAVNAKIRISYLGVMSSGCYHN